MNTTTPLETVREVDLEKYQGKWYDIAHFPSTFLSGCENITASYKVNEKGYVEVYNRCVKRKSGHVKEISGKAFPVDGSNNAKLKVQFFWPFKADYWVLDIVGDYEYVSVGGPTREYAWILSRTPDPDEKVVSEMMDKLERQGFDVSRFIRTKHDVEGEIRKPRIN